MIEAHFNLVSHDFSRRYMANYENHLDIESSCRNPIRSQEIRYLIIRHYHCLIKNITTIQFYLKSDNCDKHITWIRITAVSVAYPGIFFGGGGGGYTRNFFVGGCSTNSVEDRGQRERGSVGGSPYSGIPLNLQMSETRILIRLLGMYFPRNWEFGSALSTLRNLGGGGVWTPKPPLGSHCAVSTRKHK
jgi:hypothetical protein